MRYKRGDLLEYKWHPKNYRRVKNITTLGGMEGYEVVGVQKRDFNKEGELRIFFPKSFLEKEYILVKKVLSKIRRLE